MELQQHTMLFSILRLGELFSESMLKGMLSLEPVYSSQSLSPQPFYLELVQLAG